MEREARRGTCPVCHQDWALRCPDGEWVIRKHRGLFPTLGCAGSGLPPSDAPPVTRGAPPGRPATPKPLGPRQARQAEREALEAQGMDRCTRCDKVKPIEDFPKHGGQPRGRRSLCKPCHMAANEESKQRVKQGLTEGRRIPPYERVMAFFTGDEDPEECWRWPGTIANTTPQIRLPLGSTSVRKVIWEHHFGPLPEGYFVTVLCHPRCCNPDHIIAVTRSEMSKYQAELRAKERPTHCRHGHLWSENRVVYSLRRGGELVRCRTCFNNRRNARRRYRRLMGLPQD